jgi:hypothetical protein
MKSIDQNPNLWPELKWANWSDTAETLHMWTQIVGKTRLALSPLQAHWWNVPLYVSARGLSTSAKGRSRHATQEIGSPKFPPRATISLCADLLLC